MLIQTNAQARAALLQLNDDLQSTALALANSAIQVDTQNNLPGAAGVGSSIYNSGSSDLITNAGNLLVQVEQLVVEVLGIFDASDTPITADQITQLQNVQNTVIQTRSAVNSTISAVDWTFGDLANDAINIAVNTGSQIVGAIVKATGFDWTYVKIGAGIVGAVVLYAIYVRVSGR